jgi:hypothetical protein
MTLDAKQKKFLMIGAGLVVLYLLGEQKQKNAQKQNKVLQKTPFGFNIGFFDNSRWVDFTPKIFRKIIDNPILMQDLKLAKQNLITLNVNDDRFVISSKDGNIDNDLAYFKENGKYYKQTSLEMFKKIKNEIKLDEWKKAIEENNLKVKKYISNLENGIHTKVGQPM